MIDEQPAERVFRLPSGLSMRVMGVVADDEEGYESWEEFIREAIRRALRDAEDRRFRRREAIRP